MGIGAGQSHLCKFRWFLIQIDDTTADASTLIKKMFVYFDPVSIIPHFNRFSPELAPVVPIKVDSEA